jgi:hypothetical protein
MSPQNQLPVAGGGHQACFVAAIALAIKDNAARQYVLSLWQVDRFPWERTNHKAGGYLVINCLLPLDCVGP